MQQIALRPLPSIDESNNEVKHPIPYVLMVELKTYKVGDINIRTIVSQKHWFWMCLHGESNMQLGFTIVCVSETRRVLCKGGPAGKLFRLL